MRSPMLCLFGLLSWSPLLAQQRTPVPLTIPDLTTEARWERSGSFNVNWMAPFISLGKAKGMTIDEIGAWLGEFWTRSWAGGLDARATMYWFIRNHLNHPAGKVAIISGEDSLVIVRFNEPAADQFGPDQHLFGITLPEYRRVIWLVNEATAEFIGVQLEQRYESDWLVLTMRNGSLPPHADPQLRWQRANFLATLTYLQRLGEQMAAGKTPRQVGLDDAKLFGASWTGNDTPWRLFRAMAWNMISDHNQVCEVISHSAIEVRGRCNRPYAEVVRANVERLKVTEEDYEAAALGFQQGIAEYLGMTWNVTREGDWRMITVRRR